FVSCKNKTAEGNHMSPKIMQKLLLDINMAETLSSFQKDSLHKQGGTKNNDSLAVYYKDIFAHYNITAAQFTEDLEWYKEHPEELDSIYTDMIPIATGIQAATTPAPVAQPPAVIPIASPAKK
ncbi:MAG: hypothetical protein JWQ38_360, partial [Flavipsychrobacter sp.]|nr:hypothetical protein [Flavipsychrobacter sp.]